MENSRKFKNRIREKINQISLMPVEKKTGETLPAAGCSLFLEFWGNPTAGDSGRTVNEAPWPQNQTVQKFRARRGSAVTSGLTGGGDLVSPVCLSEAAAAAPSV